MGILRKLIGLFFLIILIFIILKWKIILQMINNVIIGYDTTPFQIGNSYIDEIGQLPNYDGSIGSYKIGTHKGGFTSSNPANTQKIFSAATVTRIDNALILTIENMQVPASSTYALWLSNTPTVSNDTRYIDFGDIKPPYSIREYRVDMPTQKINLNTYKHLLMINPKTYAVYASAVLK